MFTGVKQKFEFAPVISVVERVWSISERREDLLSTSRYWHCHHLTNIAPVAAAARPYSIVVGCRPQPWEVVGEGRHRSHEHEVVAQQTVAATQRVVDLRQEMVSSVHGELQRLYHVVHIEAIRRRVVVSADTEYVPTQLPICSDDTVWVIGAP